MASSKKARLFLSNTIVVLAILIAFTFVLASCGKKSNSGTPSVVHQEFDPNETPTSTPGESALVSTDIATSALPELVEEQILQLQNELAEAHAALLQANAAYDAETKAREADQIAFEEALGNFTEWESEKNALLAQLEATEKELTLNTPPALDFKSIQGMYEAHGELSTLTYNYEVIVEAKQTGNIFTNKTTLYSIPGALKIGVKFDNVKRGITVDDATKTVTVTIPAAYLISNEIDESGVEIYDISKGIFSKVGVEDYLYNALEAKHKAENQVRDNGMLEYAQRLAGLEFIGLLEPITSISGYQIVVVYE